MRLQIFVEDKLSEAYEILALRALGLPARRDRHRVQEDEEGLPRSPDRPAKLDAFRQAFRELCGHLSRLRADDPLRQLKVTRIVCRRCLESWLAADLQAVVDAVRGPRGIDYRPPSQRTDDLLPAQASRRLAEVIQEAGRRLERQDLKRTTTGTIKSRGASIAEHVDPARARRYNSSLAYFYDMIDGKRSGCDHPFPE